MQPSALVSSGMPYELVQVGRAQTLTLRLERDGSAVIPTSGVVSLIDPTGAVLVDEAAVTAGAVSTYVLAASVTEDSVPGEGWALRWVVEIDGSDVEYTFPAIAVIRLIQPRIGDADISRRFPHLDPADNYSVSYRQSWQPLIDDAWRSIQIRLIENGRRPWLVSDYASLLEPHILLAGARIHSTLSARGGQTMADMADRLHREYELAFTRAVLKYSETETGAEDPASARKGAAGQIVLVSPHRRRAWGRRDV